LTYLSIDCCCLLCFEDKQTKQVIVNLHKKCLKIKALEVFSGFDCTKCLNNNQPLLLSNFPLLIHCFTMDINCVIICERLKYLWYGTYCTSGDKWWPWYCSRSNLQELCIQSLEYYLHDGFMESISAHGGLVHVILEAYQITKEGFTALVKNSPNLITYHVYTQSGIITEDFIAALKQNFSQRKLFICGSCCVESKPNEDFFTDLLIQGNMDFFHFGVMHLILYS